MKKFIPFLDWIKFYDKSKFLRDLPAGITVGVMLIPQGMAYAMIIGLPPIYGLYASLVPQIIYAFLGTSRQLSMGPSAMDSLLVASGLSVIAVSGTENYLLLTILLTFLMGAFQIIMGFLRMGFIVNFLSKPVISGFTSAAAIIIGLNQINHLLGIDIEKSNQLQNILLDVYQNFSQTNIPALTIGLIGIITIITLKKINKKIPATLIVVALGIIIVSFFGLADYGVKIIGEIPEGLPSFTIPDINNQQLKEVIPIALTLAVIAFMEAISVAKAIEQKNHNYTVDPNQELIALGASNLIGSFFQSYPTTGGLSRSAVNNQAGAKTGISSLIAAIVVGLTLLFLTPLFYNLPNSILAAVIMAAVFGLIDAKYPIQLFKNRKEEFVLYIFTFIVTLCLGIIEGISLGVLFSLLLLIYRTTKPHIAILGRLPGEQKLYKNTKRFADAIEREDVLIVRFDSQLYFANSSFFKEEIDKLLIEKGDKLKLLILSAEAINFIDSSAAHMLKQLIIDIRKKGVKINFTSAIGPVRDIFKKSGITEELGQDCFFINVRGAIKFFDEGVVKTDKLITLQNNVTKNEN